MGFPHAFRQERWADIAEFFQGLVARDPRFQYLAEVVNSVIGSGSTDLLAACTSMHDLMVVPTPVPDAPVELIAVRAPGSLHASSGDGVVLIEHLSVTGNNDRIERPVSDAVPLFWRFVIEKYGVQPVARPTKN